MLDVPIMELRDAATDPPFEHAGTHKRGVLEPIGRRPSAHLASGNPKMPQKCPESGAEKPHETLLSSDAENRNCVTWSTIV
jgi:hypothetical protein